MPESNEPVEPLIPKRFKPETWDALQNIAKRLAASQIKPPMPPIQDDGLSGDREPREPGPVTLLDDIVSLEIPSQ